MGQEELKRIDPDYEYPGKKPKNIWPTIISTTFVTGVLLALFIAMLLRPLSRTSFFKANCANNLKQISTALRQYTADNNKQFPAWLGMLIIQEGQTPKLFVCPASNNPAFDLHSMQASSLAPKDMVGHQSYIYLPPQTTVDKLTPTTVVICESLNNHKTGMHVLFGDLHVEFIQADLAWPLIAELLAGQNPPPSYLKSKGLPITQPAASPSN